MSNYYLEERLPRKESCSPTELKESFLKIIDKINKFEEVYKPKEGAKANFEYLEDDKGHKYITVGIQYESSREDEANRDKLLELIDDPEKKKKARNILDEQYSYASSQQNY